MRLVLLWRIFYCSSAPVWACKGLICIRFWNGAGRQRRTLLSTCADPFQAVDPNNPEHISSDTTVQWQDEEHGSSTESEKACKSKDIGICQMLMLNREEKYIDILDCGWLVLIQPGTKPKHVTDPPSIRGQSVSVTFWPSCEKNMISFHGQISNKPSNNH